MEQPTEHNSIISDWSNLICELSQQGQSAAIGIFNSEGQLIEANPAMCYFMDTDLNELKPNNAIINPDFMLFLVEKLEGLVFEGLMTIGNYDNISYVLSAKVFRRNNRILVYAEADVPDLFEENKKMSVLNQEVNNLQRQLIKEKNTLQNTLSELKARTQELEKLNVKLSELNLEKNRYIGMVAHDLRNPIGVAVSFSNFLIEDFDEIPNETKLEYLGYINNSCSFSLNLIRDFLDVSKIEAGIFDLNLEELEYLTFVKESIIQSVILAKNKSQEIVINTNIGSIRSCLDRNKIQQVLNNLLSNAIKYSFPNTRIVIDISETDGEIITKVIDQGQGIPKEELSKVFHPFQTTSVKATASEKSTGLGLAIVKKIVEAHHGNIGVESEVGKGSTFWFSIPKKLDSQ